MSRFSGGVEMMARAKTLRAISALVGIILFCSVGGCGSSGSDGHLSSFSVETDSELRLAGGSPADVTASPQIVKLRYLFEDGAPGLCSGVVIAPQWVLTAAHCVVGGVTDMRVESVYGDYPVAEVIVHPGYFVDNTVAALFNDVALVRPELPIELTGLPQLGIIASLPVNAGDQLGAWGFGVTPDGEVGELQSAPVLTSVVTPNHIFSYGLCAGDSGGPLISQVVLDPLANTTITYGVVGIGSSGFTEGCGEGDTSLFTNLQSPAVIEFISANAPGVLMY